MASPFALVWDEEVLRGDVWPAVCDPDPLGEATGRAPTVEECDGLSPACEEQSQPAVDAGAASSTGGRKRPRREYSDATANAANNTTVICNGVEVRRKYWARRSCLWHRFHSWREPGGPPAAAHDATSVGGPRPDQSSHLRTSGQIHCHSNIRMDDEGWYSVTPERFACHLAEKAVEMVRSSASPSDAGIGILDLFAGCGGNAIAFARCPGISMTLAVDTSIERLHMTAHNASVYDLLADGDFRRLLLLHANAVDVLTLMAEANSTIGRGSSTVASLPPKCRCKSDTRRYGDVLGIERVAFYPALSGAGHPQLYVLCKDCAGTTYDHPIHVVFSAPPWGGPSYTSVTSHVFGNICLQSPSLPWWSDGPEVTAGDMLGLLCSLEVHHMHYLPRNIKRKPVAAYLRKVCKALGCKFHVAGTLYFLEGMQNGCALVLSIARGV